MSAIFGNSRYSINNVTMSLIVRTVKKAINIQKTYRLIRSLQHEKQLHISAKEPNPKIRTRSRQTIKNVEGANLNKLLLELIEICSPLQVVLKGPGLVVGGAINGNCFTLGRSSTAVPPIIPLWFESKSRLRLSESVNRSITTNFQTYSNNSTAILN